MIGASSTGIDPLTVFPPEIVLRILEYAPIATLASLTRISAAWHRFIDVTHQDAIYYTKSRAQFNMTPTQLPGGYRALPSLSPNNTCFTKWLDTASSWKDLCRRQTLLENNWAQERPATRESVLQVGNDPIWRFRTDFKRRLIISSSHGGGLNVTDMDTGRILWRLPSTLDTDKEEAVRPYAHLEYQDGMVAFDREGDGIEIWETDVEGTARGEFRRIAILDHNCQTRGFQLSYSTLCVVSTEGQGFVYDMTKRPPALITHLHIEEDAVGHLDQSDDVVVYSMGARGYHVYKKSSGEFLGALQPSQCTGKYHINQPVTGSSTNGIGLNPATRDGPFPPRLLSHERLLPIKLGKGPLPPPQDPEHVRHGEDEWGAGMLDGDLFVGFSRAGRVFVCSDWRKALRERDLAASGALIECNTDGESFDLGGWLSVRNHRVMFEIHDRVYVVALDDNNRVQADVERPARGSYSLLTGSAPQLAVPVSFMSLYDDSIMTTYTTLGRRQPILDPNGNIDPLDEAPARIFPTKMIRIVSLAPDVSSEGPLSKCASNVATSSGLWLPEDSDPSLNGSDASQTGLLQLLSMLHDELVDESDGEEVDGGLDPLVQ